MDLIRISKDPGLSAASITILLNIVTVDIRVLKVSLHDQPDSGWSWRLRKRGRIPLFDGISPLIHLPLEIVKGNRSIRDGSDEAA